MDKKTEEMIALGAAYAVNCQPCMEYHKQQALEAGLTSAEMLFAIRVAEGVKTGATAKTRQKAETLFGRTTDERCCPVGSECCP